jgi:hypothetical protein
VAARSGAPQRVDGAGAALVTVVVALSRRLQGDRPDLALRPAGAHLRSGFIREPGFRFRPHAPISFH